MDIVFGTGPSVECLKYLNLFSGFRPSIGDNSIAPWTQWSADAMSMVDLKKATPWQTWCRVMTCEATWARQGGGSSCLYIYIYINSRWSASPTATLFVFFVARHALAHRRNNTTSLIMNCMPWLTLASIQNIAAELLPDIRCN